jgi:hypothetical protein
MKKSIIILILIFIILLSVSIIPKSYRYEEAISLYSITIVDHNPPHSTQSTGG